MTTRVPTALRIPKAWTFRESAKLLGRSYWTVKRMYRDGEIAGRVDVWYTRIPGSPHAYKRSRGYISSEELLRWMREQEAKTAAARTSRRRSPGAKRRGADGSGDAYEEYGPLR